MVVKSQVKYIQTLSQKKFRDEESAFVAEGPKIVHELLEQKNTGLLQLYATKEWMTENNAMVSNHAQKIQEIADSELKRISFQQTPHQVLGIFKKPVFRKPVFAGKVNLMLDGIQDPGNFGTMLRTADWFGIENIICSKECADAYNPKVVQSTMGSIARVQVIYVNLQEFIGEHPSIPVFATALNGRSLFEMDQINEGFILIGNESKGVHENLLGIASHKITIPRTGHAESLNAAVAAGIIMAWIRK